MWLPAISMEMIPLAYGIKRLDDPDVVGYQEISLFAVEKYLEEAPFPSERCHKKNNPRYPKEYQDIENQFSPGVYYEYPTKNYPYNQNAKGIAYEILPGGSRGERIKPGYIRTITDRCKNVKGVCYHPSFQKRKHVRAEELNRRVCLRIFSWRFYIPSTPHPAEIRDFVSSIFARRRVLWEEGARYLGRAFTAILFKITGGRGIGDFLQP